MISLTMLATLVVIAGMMVLSLWLERAAVSLAGFAISLIAIYYGILNNWQPIPFVLCGICAAVEFVAFLKQAFKGDLI